jgi:hypothetical protein
MDLFTNEMSWGFLCDRLIQECGRIIYRFSGDLYLTNKSYVIVCCLGFSFLIYENEHFRLSPMCFQMPHLVKLCNFFSLHIFTGDDTNGAALLGKTT